MQIHSHTSSILVMGVVFALAASPVFAAFDRKTLLDQGEDYVVALHDTYAKAAQAETGAAHPEIAKFFKDRVREIEQGGETFPAHPSDFPIADAGRAARLEWAYEETYDLVTSEAGDEAPYLVADVQITYEKWLITLHLDPHDPQGPALDREFNKRLDALTNPQNVSQNFLATVAWHG